MHVAKNLNLQKNKIRKKRNELKIRIYKNSNQLSHQSNRETQKHAVMSQSHVKKRAFVEFANCLKIHVGQQVVTRIQIGKAINESSYLKADQVEIISQVFSNKEWFITLKDEVKASQFVGKIISINGNNFNFADANAKMTKEQEYKILWLPHRFEKTKIRTFFDKFHYEVTNIEDEYFNEGIAPIKTGNIMVKAKLKEGRQSEKEQWLRSGHYEINGLKIFIIRKGDKPKCFLCDQVGHKRLDCPKKNLKCLKCNKIGHSTEQCNAAKRLEIFDTNLPEIFNEDKDTENEQEKHIKVQNINVNKEIIERDTRNSRKRNAEESPEKADIEKELQKSVNLRSKSIGDYNRNEQLDKINIDKIFKQGVLDKIVKGLPDQNKEQLEDALNRVKNQNISAKNIKNKKN